MAARAFFWSGVGGVAAHVRERLRTRLRLFVGAPTLFRIEGWHAPQPPVQLINQDERPATDLNSAKVADPDRLIQGCSPNTCNRARFGKAINEMSFHRIIRHCRPGHVPAPLVRPSARWRIWLEQIAH
jgi:hypothetical protein